MSAILFYETRMWSELDLGGFISKIIVGALNVRPGPGMESQLVQYVREEERLVVGNVSITTCTRVAK